MKIKKLRISQNISQKDMSKILGISQSALCMYESGQRKPSIELLPEIAKVLNCTVDELLRVDEPEETDKTKSQTSGNLEIENDSNKIKA